MNPGFFVCALAKIDVEVLKIPYSQDFLFYEIDVFKMQFNLMAEIKRISVSRYSILYSSTVSIKVALNSAMRFRMLRSVKRLIRRYP